MILLDGNKQDVQPSGRRLADPSRMTRGAECFSSTDVDGEPRDEN